jgi:hypothetical protein
MLEKLTTRLCECLQYLSLFLMNISKKKFPHFQTHLTLKQDFDLTQLKRNARPDISLENVLNYTNVTDKAWLDPAEKSYKLQCKIRLIQSSLESL